MIASRVGLRALAGLLLLAACAAPRPAPPPGPRILPSQADEAERARLVAARAGAAEVIYLGEMHDNPHHHRAQARVLAALLEGGARPALAVEMIPEDDQEVLDDALTRADTAADAERLLRWTARGWPDFDMYWPLFELARRYRLPVVATDLAPSATRLISRSGLAALGAEGGRLGSRLPPDPALDRAIGRRIQAGHCNLVAESRLPRMVESWYARNVTIARRLVAALGRAPQVVVIIGRGHQKEGGVPAQLAAIRPGTRQFVLELLEVEAGETPPAAAGHGSGDLLWLTPPVERPDPCRGLQQRLG